MGFYFTKLFAQCELYHEGISTFPFQTCTAVYSSYDISSSNIIRICGSLYIHFTVYLDPCFIFWAPDLNTESLSAIIQGRGKKVFLCVFLNSLTLLTTRVDLLFFPFPFLWAVDRNFLIVPSGKNETYSSTESPFSKELLSVSLFSEIIRCIFRCSKIYFVRGFSWHTHMYCASFLVWRTYHLAVHSDSYISSIAYDLPQLNNSLSKVKITTRLLQLPLQPFQKYPFILAIAD